MLDEGRSSPLSAFPGSVLLLLDLLLVVGLHLLLDILLDVVLEDESAQPYPDYVDAILQILQPIFLGLFAVYPPDSDGYLLPTLSAVPQLFL